MCKPGCDKLVRVGVLGLAGEFPRAQIAEMGAAWASYRGRRYASVDVISARLVKRFVRQIRFPIVWGTSKAATRRRFPKIHRMVSRSLCWAENIAVNVIKEPVELTISVARKTNPQS